MPPSQAKSARAAQVVSILRQTYPDARCSLNFTTPLEILVATILAAQCTDERVNATTVNLFKKYHTAADYANVPVEELEVDIKSTGFYRNKAKSIQGMARMLLADYGGEVPEAMPDLLRLPGVARKTANVVQGNAFHHVEGVVVDTHVTRLSRRLGFTTADDPPKIERDMMELLPHSDWFDFSNLLIYHGRAICKAPTPLCPGCPLLDLCPAGRERTSQPPLPAE
ncbi:MAG: endonuclease III [Ktedonobacterales bacterium]|nr:endonuclease III [Ktedonobacterales bacterium]